MKVLQINIDLQEKNPLLSPTGPATSVRVRGQNSNEGGGGDLTYSLKFSQVKKSFSPKGGDDSLISSIRQSLRGTPIPFEWDADTR